MLAEVEEGVDLVVAGQEGRLIQVLRNLVENARSFSPPNGTVRLQARQDGTAIVISVEDDGPGLPPAIAADVFEPFISGKENGTGLGLALVSKLICDGGGWITVDSVPWRTCFRISLPLAPKDTETGED